MMGILLFGSLIQCDQKENLEYKKWSNPIRAGINSYGMKDFFVFTETNHYYLVGTEFSNPFDFTRQKPNLYMSDNFLVWKNLGSLIDHSKIPEDAWYRDHWHAPEIISFDGRYYLTFNNGNNSTRPYKKTGFGIAVSDQLKGPYQVMNTKAPLVESNHGSLTESPDGKWFLTYDMDGRIFIAEIDLKNASLLSVPKEMLGPETLKENYKYLDAPQITKVGNYYHLLFSQFYGGYLVKINHMIAEHPLGPWDWTLDNPLYTFLESEADLEVKMEYPEPNGYAPPTQVIFSNQLFKGLSDSYFIAYHSSEKYSEPYLCIEPVSLIDHQILPISSKNKHQKAIVK